MTIKCSHWNQVAGLHGGRCDLKDKTVSPGVCAACADYDGPPRRMHPQTESLACSACNVAPQRWLGMDWYGVPFVKRLRLQSPIYIKRMPGCGCLVRLKDWCAEVASGKTCFHPNAKLVRALGCAIFGI